MFAPAKAMENWQVFIEWVPLYLGHRIPNCSIKYCLYKSTLIEHL